MDNPLLKQAIELSRSGKKLEARKLLKQVLSSEPTNETAWLWFVDTLPNDRERMIALEGLLKINPNSKVGRIGLEQIKKRVQQKTASDKESTAPVPSHSHKTERKVHVTGPPLEAFPGQKPLEETLLEKAVPPPTEGQGYSPQKKEGSPYRLSTLSRWLLSFLLGLGLLGIIGWYLVSVGLGKYIPFFGAVSTESACPCAESDAYLIRVQDRVERFRTSQALTFFSQVQVTRQANVAFAKKLYEDELKETPPECVQKVHEQFLLLLEYNLKFSQEVQNGNKTPAKFYLNSVEQYQSQLRDEFERLSKGYTCSP